MTDKEQVAAVEAKFDGKRADKKLCKDWWLNETWPAEWHEFAKALGADPETEILCISPDHFAWPPSEGFSEDESIEFSRDNPTIMVSVLSEETEDVLLNGICIGTITCCRSSVEWKANGISGRNL